MRFVKCGSKLFRPDAVTAVELNHGPGQGDVKVTVPGGEVVFHRAEAEAVREFFGRIPCSDLMGRDGDDEPEAAAANHAREEC
jgi:hypothetical protein